MGVWTEAWSYIWVYLLQSKWLLITNVACTRLVLPSVLMMARQYFRAIYTLARVQFENVLFDISYYTSNPGTLTATAISCQKGSIFPDFWTSLVLVLQLYTKYCHPLYVLIGPFYTFHLYPTHSFQLEGRWLNTACTGQPSYYRGPTVNRS